MTRTFLTARWQHLLFINIDVDPALLRRWVPQGTELDLFDGRAIVSLVGFRFLETRLLGVPIPWHRDFEEVNLRAYVHRRVDGVWRRGVVFVRELVPRPAIAWTARLAYNEPYRAVPMRHQVSVDEKTGGSVRYEWRQGGRWNVIAARVAGSAAAIDPASEVGFITEHYFGYCGQRDGSTVEYAVAHPRWRVWQNAEPVVQCDIASVYGGEWVSALAAAPSSAFLCDGSPVSVSFPSRFQGSPEQRPEP
jgi:uncharacterized protein